MKEQLYVIARMEDTLSASLVTETELKRRIDLAFGDIPHKWDWSYEINMLLGEETKVKSLRPTREDWEEWARKVASFLTDRQLGDYYQYEIKDLLMEMPGIPKEYQNGK